MAIDEHNTLPPTTLSSPADLVKIGSILNIVDVNVVVESVRSMPPLDLDSVLFKENGEPLGRIFDVFGSIRDPHYSIKFDHADEVSSRGICAGMPVYFLPQNERTVTKFAFVDELKKIKGTDASWENDNEPPEGMIEYSDDEEEAASAKCI